MHALPNIYCMRAFEPISVTQTYENKMNYEKILQEWLLQAPILARSIAVRQNLSSKNRNNNTNLSYSNYYLRVVQDYR